ncbi:MAG: LON peptidase substrate-binding domain-containing protein, partial [Myxococcales bacterium]|nr:LON peptidase substrate-binding domain-containing protein [Myxococcales bacterium]
MSDESAIQVRPQVPPELPVIAVKNAVIFPIPNLPVPLAVGRARTMAAIEQASAEDGMLLILTQRNGEDEEPGEDDLYEVGSVARILRISRGFEGPDELLIEGICRARVEGFTEVETYLRARVAPLIDSGPPEAETDALLRTLKDLAGKVIQLSPRIPDEALSVVEGIDDPGHLADLVASQLRMSVPERQALLEIWDVKTRLNKVIEALAHEAAVLEISGRIRTEVRDSLDKHQREVYLREQLKAIRKELGDDAGDDDDLEDLEERIAKARMPEVADKAARRELRRLRRMNPQSAEATVARSYVDWLLDVPWNTSTTDNLDVRAAAELLDEDHYGLAQVKRRITEYLAVRKLKGDMKGPILCLVGPPGVGKTTLALAVAAQMQHHYRDGVVFVPLAAISDPILMVVTIATAVGSSDQSPKPPQTRLIEFLRHKHLLLVLDNVEQISEAAPAMAALVAECPE